MVYDALLPPRVDVSTEQAVEFLAGLAGTGPVLELGIGTGRIALPLASRGITVQGIDASESMVERLRAKPGGADIPVTIGDFVSLPVVGRFSLIYVVFNTFFALLSQDDQVGCFAQVAEHLAPGGAFVIEAFVPDPSMYDRGQRVSTSRVEVDRVQIDAATLDPVTQRVTSQHVLIGKEGILLLPVQLRYAWPSELDLMARLAGLHLEARYAGWQREPFIATSPGHVSVFSAGG
jgi:SAM-dependent methyltransferase